MQVAQAAAAAASQGGTAKAGFVLKEVAKLTLQLSHEQLQAEAARIALEGLQALEGVARQCVVLLVQALRSPESRPDLAADAAWTLHKLTQRCDVTRRWTLEAEGLKAVHYALVTYSAHHDLVQCCVGIVYCLDGLRGLAMLLSSCATGDSAHLPNTVIADILWCVHDLLRQDQAGPEVVTLLQMLLTLLTQRSQDQGVQHACCATLGVLVGEDPRLGSLLVDFNGVPLLLETLRCARSSSNAPDGLASDCVGALASLARGSAAQAEVLRQCGVVEVLAQCCIDGQNGCEESAVWALGHLAGINVVMQAMESAPNSLGVMRGALDVIQELACQANTREELELLPPVLRALLGLLNKTMVPEPVVNCRKRCVAAICSTVMGLAPHVDPGNLLELDQAIDGLLRVQTRELGKEADADIAEIALESLGRLALLKPSWNAFLREHRAVELFSVRIGSAKEHRRLLKYAFWAAAALSGLPFVCEELHKHLRSAGTIDAAFCTIIDILDDDLEGDWVLKDAARCSKDDVPCVLKLIAEAMAGYPADNLLQSRGCHCIGLLAGLALPSPHHVAAIEAVFAALRRHSRLAHVVRDACYAFHCLLEPGCWRGDAGAAEAREAVVATLRHGGAEELAMQALIDHADSKNNSELLEEAVIILCNLSGVHAALQALLDAGPGIVRTVGVKAIAEFGRQQPLLLNQSAVHVAAAVAKIAEEAGEDDALQQNIALLIGFCQCSA